MTLSRQEAAQALQDIESSQARSRALSGYQRAAPHLMLWGAVWFIGYGLSALLRSSTVDAVWAVLVVLGSLGSWQLARRQGRSRDGWRFAALFVALALFVSAAFAVFAPVSARQSAAFFPLLVALAYALLGIWRGPRMIVAGLLVGALTLVGYFALGTLFFAWMALVGSGAMIGLGLWLRRV